MDWTAFWSQFGGIATATLVVGYLARKLIEMQISKGLESYSADLERTLEDYKAVIRRAEIRYSGLYARQAESIEHVARDLRGLYRAAEAYVSHMQGADAGDEAKTATFQDALDRFGQSFDERRVYFNRDQKARLDQLKKDIFGVAWDFKMGRQGFTKRAKERSEDEDFYFWSDCVNRLRDKVGPALVLLEDDFAHLLGVEETGDRAGHAGLEPPPKEPPPKEPKPSKAQPAAPEVPK